MIIMLILYVMVIRYKSLNVKETHQEKKIELTIRSLINIVFIKVEVIMVIDYKLIHLCIYALNQI